MIYFKSNDGYLSFPHHGCITWVPCIQDARQFEDLEAYNKDTYDWEREELSLLTIEIVTLL